MSIASDKPQLSGYGQPTWDVARLFPAQGCWTEEDYLELKPNRWVEFSHGFVEFLATPTLTHQLAALYLYRTLQSFVSTEQLGTALAGPYRVRLWEGKYREPDVLFVGGETCVSPDRALLQGCRPGDGGRQRRRRKPSPRPRDQARRVRQGPHPGILDRRPRAGAGSPC